LADIQLSFIFFVMVCDIYTLEHSIQQRQLDIRVVRDMCEQASILHDYMSPAEHIFTVAELEMFGSLESKLQKLESKLRVQIQGVAELMPGLHMVELSRQRTALILGACIQRAAAAAGVR
jgi:hypothetical protein